LELVLNYEHHHVLHKEDTPTEEELHQHSTMVLVLLFQDLQVFLLLYGFECF
jgi:hypothetical protein